MQEYRRQGYTVAADLDLARFFDSVNFDVLMRRVAAKVPDRRVLRLIWRYLRAGVVENGKWSPTEKGVPQGGPLSPLLANIVLHDLDTELEKRGHKFARYADDFLVLVKSERAGQRVMASLMGVSPNCAIPTALSRKSYWHMARTLATQSGMTNAWLESQGLVSVRTLWIAFHYPAASQSGLPAPAAG